MIDKPLESVEAADVLAVVESGRIEDVTIEYKENIPGATEGQRAEFLADVASFANASGGDILYGVSEDAGRPKAAPGIDVKDFDSLRLQWQNSIRAAIAPRVPAFEIREIVGFANGSVIVLRIHPSWTLPHMVTLGGRSKFYVRAAGQKREMDVQELRAAFLGSEAVADRIRAFRDARLGKILAGDTPIGTWPFLAFAIHVLPIGAAFATADLDPRTIGDEWMILNRSPAELPEIVFAAAKRSNLDGLLVYSEWFTERYKKTPSYIQIFRNGGVEFVWFLYDAMREKPEALRELDGVDMEWRLVNSVTDAIEFRARLNRPLPVVVMASVVRARGVELVGGLRRPVAVRRAFDRDVVVVPELIMDNDLNIANQLRAVIDVVWQSAGFGGSPHYDDKGQWKQPRR